MKNYPKNVRDRTKENRLNLGLAPSSYCKYLIEVGNLSTKEII